MPNYREQTGEVGTYNGLKVHVLHGGDFLRGLAKDQLNYTTIYCLKDFDPYHKLLPDCMYAYMINKDDPNNVYCLGTMGNYGKVNFKKNIGSCEKFAITRKSESASKETPVPPATDFETVGNFYVPNKLFCNLRDSNTNKVSSVNLELNKITIK